MHLKRLAPTTSTADLTQLLLVFTSRANPILDDFVRHVYWFKEQAARCFVKSSWPPFELGAFAKEPDK